MQSEQTKHKKDTKKKTKITDENAQLIVFNDDYNTFDHVINCFVEICKLTFEEAEAKTLSIHFNGMDVVKEGIFEELKKEKDALNDNGLSAIVQRANLN